MKSSRFLQTALVAALFVIGCFYGRLAVAQEHNSDRLREQLTIEGAAKWQDCMDAYLAFQVDLEYNVFDMKSPGTPTSTYFEIARQHEDSFYLKSKRTSAVKQRASYGRFELRATNPQYSFALEQKDDSDDWVMVEGSVDPDGVTRTLGRPIAKSKAQYFKAPLWVSQFVFLPDLVASPYFNVVNISMAVIDGRELCRVEYELEVQGKKGNDVSLDMLVDDPIHADYLKAFMPRAGQLTLDPKHFWVIVEHEADVYLPQSDREKYARMTIVRKHEYDFDDSTGDLPRIRRIANYATLERHDGSLEVDNALYSTWDYKLVESTMSPADFRLTAFGLPELEYLADQENEASSSWWWIVLFCAAVILLVAALWYVKAYRGAHR